MAEARREKDKLQAEISKLQHELIAIQEHQKSDYTMKN